MLIIELAKGNFYQQQLSVVWGKGWGTLLYHLRLQGEKFFFFPINLATIRFGLAWGKIQKVFIALKQRVSKFLNLLNAMFFFQGCDLNPDVSRQISQKIPDWMEQNETFPKLPSGIMHFSVVHVQ